MALPWSVNTIMNKNPPICGSGTLCLRLPVQALPCSSPVRTVTGGPPPCWHHAPPVPPWRSCRALGQSAPKRLEGNTDWQLGNRMPLELRGHADLAAGVTYRVTCQLGKLVCRIKRKPEEKLRGPKEREPERLPWFRTTSSFQLLPLS